MPKDCLEKYFEHLFVVDLGSDEESGKDWSDLEREAAEEDRNRDKDDYVEDRHSSKKRSHHR